MSTVIFRASSRDRRELRALLVAQLAYERARAVRQAMTTALALAAAALWGLAAAAGAPLPFRWFGLGSCLGLLALLCATALVEFYWWARRRHLAGALDTR